MLKRVLYIFLVFLTVSCVDNEVKLPDGYLSHDEMVPIMVDIHLVEGARSGKLMLGDTNSLPDYYARIYEKHNVTEQKFKESFEWYTRYPGELKSVYEKSIEQLSILEAEIKAKGSRPIRDSE